ncbi:7408_t:CDS:2 [Gigaspora margarita]|uniref:7408_t:CDS:1 n=1 Tax=Gigaspora margarita TaxID=4874 RepID=A0ABM8VWR5_GIGMA|nr:7408_t:CDS:2 [Gigaspora margarita]
MNLIHLSIFLGNIPQELYDLTDIEEMLIAQVFPVISVYKLRGGQYAYNGNVVNFPQDMHEFVTRLPRSLSSLNTLVVRYHVANRSTFRDFHVRREKIVQTLNWLKANNIFYKDINIDGDILQSLPENGSVIDPLLQIRNEDSNIEAEENTDSDVNGYENFISQTFVPSLPPGQNENNAINETFNCMQQNYSAKQQLIAAEVLDLMHNDPNIANRVVRCSDAVIGKMKARNIQT